MTCKQCNKEILNKELGLRDFCSTECRGDFRRAYFRFKTQKRRNNEKMKINIDPSEVNKSNPDESTIPGGSESMSETLYESFGGRTWYSLAKRDCCNFDVRAKESYCVELFEPRKTFRSKCRDRQLGKDLMNKAKETKKRKQMKR
jgi:hypothetical protein